MQCGDVVGDRFEIERFAAAGGMGVIYRALDRQRGCPAALKIVHAVDATARERFAREARLLEELADPGVVAYLAHGPTGPGDLFLAMEWLEGEDLAARLAAAELSFAETLAVVCGAAAALSRAHARQVVHRDVKPSNLFLVDWRPDRVKLLDFGVARLGRAATLTGAGFMVGTPMYMAPEQVRGTPVDARADVFALGTILFRCLTGRHPFDGETAAELCARIASDDAAPPVAALAPDTPPVVAALCARMLSKDAARRPRDAGEVLAALVGLSGTEVRERPSAAPPELQGTGSLARARTAMARCHWREARDAFEAALREAESPEAHSGLGEVLFWLGDASGSINEHERAYEGYVKGGNVVQAAMSAVGIAVTYKKSLGNQAACAGWLARAARTIDSLGAPPLECLLLLGRSIGATRPEQGVAAGRRALAIARQVGNRDLELMALATLGEALVALGEVEDGMAHIDESMAGAVGGEYRDPGTLAAAMCAMVTACDRAADRQRIEDWCRAAERQIQTLGNPLLFADCRGRYGATLFSEGRWREAETELIAALGMAPAETSYHAVAAMALARLRVAQGRLDEAAALLAGPVGDRREARPVVAALRLARGEPAVAAGLLRRYLAVSELQPGVVTALALEVLCEAQLASGDAAAARETAERLAMLSVGQPPRIAGRAALAGGWTADTPAHAVGCFERAVELFQEATQPYDAARARLALARALGTGQREVAIAEAREAVATFERLGAARDVAGGTELLRSLE